MAAVAVVAALVAAAVVVEVAVVASEVSDQQQINLILSLMVNIGYQQGPPERVITVAEVSHITEGQIIGMIKGDAVPLLARMIYTENKQLIGKVDDVFGPKNQPGIAVNPDTNSGVKAESFKAGDIVS